MDSEQDRQQKQKQEWRKTKPQEHQRMQEQKTYCHHTCNGGKKNIKNICKKQGIQAHFKNGKTLWNMHVTPKDKGTIMQKSGMVYRFKHSSKVDCYHGYIGETSKAFSEILKEHLKTPSPSMTTNLQQATKNCTEL